MLDYAKIVALRAKEICFLNISDLPDKETVKKNFDTQENVYLHLRVTKGSKEAVKNLLANTESGDLS